MERRKRPQQGSRAQPERATRTSSRRISERSSQRAAIEDHVEATSQEAPAAQDSGQPGPSSRSVSGTKRKRVSRSRSRSRSRSPATADKGGRGAGSSRDQEVVPPLPAIPPQYQRQDSDSAPSAPPPQGLLDFHSQHVQDDRTYELVVVEQPQNGCAFGQEPLSRIPIFPPLIARLRIFDKDGVEITAGDDMPFLTCQVSLLTADGGIADLVVPRIAGPVGSDPEATAPTTTKRRGTSRKLAGRPGSAAGSQTSTADGSSSASRGTTQKAEPKGRESGPSTPRHIISGPARMLAGDRPAHAEIYYDMDNQRRLLFIFSEICIRLAGKFRLQLTLTRLPSSGLSLPLPSFALASTVTDIITVVERDEFAIGGPTPLMKCLQRQGVSFPVSDNTGAEEARAS